MENQPEITPGGETPEDEMTEYPGLPEISADTSIADGLFDLVRGILHERTDNIDAEKAFNKLHEHDSIPSLDPVGVLRARDLQTARVLEDTRVQGYIEANFGVKVLELIKGLVPLFFG